jgi:uncharacterized protein (DUF885 family)
MRLLVATAVAALAVACSPPANKPDVIAPELIAKASADLTVYLDKEYEEELALSPIKLTFLGRKEQYDKLDDFSDAATDRDLAWRRESVAEMRKAFDPVRLDEEARTSFEMWALQLDFAEKAAKFRRQPYVFVKDGPHVFLPNFLITFHEVSEKPDMEAYIARLSEMAQALDQGLENTKLSAAQGDRPPRFSYDQALQESRLVITGAPFGKGADSPLLADAKTKIKALQDGGKINAEESKAFLDGGTAALKDKVKPAYDRLIAWLEEDKPNTAPEAKGVSTLTDGTRYYNTQLEIQTTTQLTADEIHELGLKEVARIRSEMEKIREQVGFKGDLPATFEFMRKDKQFYLPDTDAGRAAYLKQADDYLAGMKAKLPEYFGIMPKADLVVKRVEAFREEKGGVQHYYPGTPDGSRPGIYYAHLSDMTAMPTWDLENTTYHEGLPGHHMQISIAQELKGIPQFRTQADFTAYAEGWGLYTELLAKEMGFYPDPWSDMGRLNAEMWRAVRLVVDTGIHAKGWTEEQAVKYFMDNSPTPEAAVRAEIRRYFVWPGQATSYKIGMLKILELRAMARNELGDKFDWRGFHDTVLSGGALPLSVLEARVKRWVEKVKATAAG